MAINKKLITFDKKLTFLGANGINNLSSPVNGYYNLIPTWSMVFIKDTGEIWHDGVYFGKPIKDQISPIMQGTTKGLVFTPNGIDYYYKTFNLWGNTFDGDTININGDLVVQGVTYRWTYGDASIKKGNTNLIAFSNNANNYDVFIPNGNLNVTGGDIDVNNSKIKLSSTGSIKGTHILNTNSYFNADNTLGKTWNSIKLFNTSGTTISLDTTRPAIINILEHAHASNTLWVPWIAGGDITEQSSWGIGLGGDAFYIGRIAKSHTENSLSEYWKFSPTSGLCLYGTTKYITVEGLENSSTKVFMADGTVKTMSALVGEGISEASTTAYGGFKLTYAKASSQQALSSNTNGAGRYAIKMNADGTLYVDITQANTWIAFTAASENSAGTAGYIQAPAGAQNKFFRGDNTWQALGASAFKAFDTTVTSGSSNLITSGAVYNYVNNYITSTLSGLSLTSEWTVIEDLSSKLTDGSYVIQITYGSKIYTGYFSYVVEGINTDDEIVLHCSGTNDSIGGVQKGRIYAKIGTNIENKVCLKMAATQAESNVILTIKYKKLI